MGCTLGVQALKIALMQLTVEIIHRIFLNRNSNEWHLLHNYVSELQIAPSTFCCIADK